MNRDHLLTLYRDLKPIIQEKFLSFQKSWEDGDESIFRELCFCILTANTSASLSIRTMEHLESVDFDDSEQILQVLQKNYRFYNTRTNYISTTRAFLKQDCSLKMQQKIISFGLDKIALRDYFALTKSIKGIGFKESSHFLRNIGFLGYAILDKHIVHSLYEFGVIDSPVTPRTRVEYLDMENKLKQFADSLSIDMNHLDLLLWYRKTGEILK